MKTPNTQQASTGTLTVLFLLLLAAALTFVLSVRAQSPGVNRGAVLTKTNDCPMPFTTVTAATVSNIVGYGNSGGFTAGAAMRLPYQQPMDVYVSFTCATVTLANVAVVLQLSADSNLWENVAGRTIVLNTGASAASAGNTNIVLRTNLSTTVLGNANWMRVASVTNGNAASATSLRVQTANP